MITYNTAHLLFPRDQLNYALPTRESVFSASRFGSESTCKISGTQQEWRCFRGQDWKPPLSAPTTSAYAGHGNIKFHRLYIVYVWHLLRPHDSS